MVAAAIIVSIVLVVAVVLWFFVNRKNPENASTHGERDRTGSALMHGDTDDRPAGPGAEDEFVSGDGQIGPGPSAETLPWPQDRQQ
ncbi:MAG: hypothetical protein JWN62_4363 [Acidimicrobiales bacterium]|nr:hypothetical protein [Acidimicrobiales bacterium]